MLSEFKVGPQTLDNGVTHPGASSRFAAGAQVVADGAGRYQEAVLRGNVYFGANAGGTPVTTQAGLSATTPALTLYNPVGSGVYLSLLEVLVDITSSPAAAAGLMLAYNALNATAPATTTAATVINALIGQAAANMGQCYRIATLAAAPVAFRFLGGTTGAAAIGGVQLKDDVGGAVIVMPGVAISIQATSAAAILAQFTWEEIDI